MGEVHNLHFVAESAIRREQRDATRLRIVDAAQRLADAHGLDGFTMERLAEAAGVSRRTLFNYFPGKVDAVLGPRLAPAEEVLAEFRSGGPTGDLVDDLGVIVTSVLDSDDLDAGRLARLRRILEAHPALLGALHGRFHELVTEVVEAAVEREDGDFDPFRAKVAVSVLAALADTAVDHALQREQDDIAAAFREAVAHTRHLFG